MTLAMRLAPYAVHLANCPLESWKERGRGEARQQVACQCGLFQLLQEAKREESWYPAPKGRALE